MLKKLLNCMNRKAAVSTLLLVTLALAACAKRPKPTPGAYGWTTTENQHAKLSDYKGKVVVLDFYATWCEPCRAETPHLVQMQHRYGAKGFQVIGLNVGGEEDHAQVPAFAKEFDVQYPLVFPDDELVDMYLRDNQNIPQAFVFDRNGEIVKRFVGYSDESRDEMERLVQAVLESKSQQASQ
jgi:thiol-disulfide isomerase/thioredoxin